MQHTIYFHSSYCTCLTSAFSVVGKPFSSGSSNAQGHRFLQYRVKVLTMGFCGQCTHQFTRLEECIGWLMRKTLTYTWYLFSYNLVLQVLSTGISRDVCTNPLVLAIHTQYPDVTAYILLLPNRYPFMLVLIMQCFRFQNGEYLAGILESDIKQINREHYQPISFNMAG